MHTIDLLLITVSPDYQDKDFVDDFMHINEVRLFKLIFFHISFQYKNFPDSIIFRVE